MPRRSYSFFQCVKRNFILGTLLLVFTALPLHGHAQSEASHVTKECLCWIVDRAAIEDAPSVSLFAAASQLPYRHQAAGLVYVSSVPSILAIRAPPQIV
jgi:hypothetical protein